MSTSTNTTFEFDVNHNGEFKLNPLTYQDGSVLNINVPAMDFEDMVSYLKRKITRGFTTLYYTLPPNNTLLGMKAIKNDYDTIVMYDIAKVAEKLRIFIHALYYEVPHSGFSITVKLRNNYDMHVMFDIAAAQGKLEIYIDHLSVKFIIAKHICPNASLAEMMNYVIADYTSDSEDERRKVTQNDYTFDEMVEWAEQEHFENGETKELQRQKPIWKNRMY
ncbi:hypothetical protein Tco_1215018 [Tanacetum coccineum]